MSRFFRSFYGRLTSVFLVVLLIMGVLQVWITTCSFINFNQEVDQRLNATLAKDMAFELTSILKDDLDLDRIGERIHYMMVMNPKIEIYLLDELGTILAFFAEPGKQVLSETVDLDPVYQFLLQGEQVPILGSDPRQPGKYKPFSAAELNLSDDSKGFLYIIIGGEKYDSVYAIFQNSYIARTMINGLITTVVFAGLIGLILFAILTKRLRALSEIASAFAGGDLEHRIQIQSRDEFGQLGQAFNTMADTIEETIEKLRQNDLLRRELIANVSHDLRTPLAAVQGFVETILMKEDLAPQRKQEYLEIILKNTQGLSQQVEELFELSKLEAKQIKPKLEAFSIAELVQDIALKFSNMAQERGLELDTHISSQPPMVLADIAMIDRVLSNLIRNATEHTPSGGQIKIQIEASDGLATISVSDTGKGIDPEDLPFIFDRFYTSGKKTVKDSTSTGLGLTIASKMIEAHGQTLSVNSTPDLGTQFYFTLSTV